MVGKGTPPPDLRYGTHPAPDALSHWRWLSIRMATLSLVRTYSCLPFPCSPFQCCSSELSLLSLLGTVNSVGSLQSSLPLSPNYSHFLHSRISWALLLRCSGNNSAPKCSYNLILHSCVWFLLPIFWPMWSLKLETHMIPLKSLS